MYKKQKPDSCNNACVLNSVNRWANAIPRSQIETMPLNQSHTFTTFQTKSPLSWPYRNCSFPKIYAWAQQWISACMEIVMKSTPASKYIPVRNCILKAIVRKVYVVNALKCCQLERERFTSEHQEAVNCCEQDVRNAYWATNIMKALPEKYFVTPLPPSFLSSSVQSLNWSSD
jgi:hypothetical protein